MIDNKDCNRPINQTFHPNSMMQKILVCLLLLAMTVPMLAEGSEPPVFVPTRSQRAVRTSTDVILVALPATAIATTLILKDWEGLKQGAFSAAATVGATFILKFAVHEKRPDFSNHHSFPSGHSSFTFAAATFIGQRYGWKYGIPACALATYTAWGRVYGKKHHWWDVVTGAAIGAASSLIFTHPYMKRHEFAIVPVATETEAGVCCSFKF